MILSGGGRKKNQKIAGRELYGYLDIFALICLVLFVLYKYPYYPKFALYPKQRTIVMFRKKEIA